MAVALVLAVIVGVLATADGRRGLAKHTLRVDILRDGAITYIDNLWINVTQNYEWIYNAEKDKGMDSAVMVSFKTVCDGMNRMATGPVPVVVAESVWNYARIQQEVVDIEGLYDNFRKYQLEPPYKHRMFKQAWEDLATLTLHGSDTLHDVSRALEIIHDLITGSERSHTPSLYGIIKKEGETTLCHIQQSPLQVIYNLYNSLQMTQLKGYTMMQFSWMLLRIYKKGNFTVESRMMRERYLERMADQATSLKTALEKADAAYWKCDPKQQVEGETYLQLTRLIQGYIQNEVDMNPKQSCRENCGYYQVTKQHSCYENNFCARQKSCNGDIVECQYIDSDMWVCQADSMVSKRRYDWIEYENGRVLGNKKSCQSTSKVDSWWRWVFWHCSYCFCLCDDVTHSDRYFSLRPVVADTANNKVITGVRFVKMNGVVHIQVQEGLLEGYGQINETSSRWKPVDNFKIADAKEDADYMKMSYYKRAIDLDDLSAPPDHVVTGVKFRMVGSHLNLEISATPFNFTSGRLEASGFRDQWISSDKTDGSVTEPRTRLTLESPDHPLNSLSPSRVDSKHNQFLEFTHSDIDLDAAQTTVPFLDAQMVAPSPPVPLSGLGVYHKGTRWFGGFVGLRVFTYDFTAHVKSHFEDMNDLDVVN